MLQKNRYKPFLSVLLLIVSKCGYAQTLPDPYNGQSFVNHVRTFDILAPKQDESEAMLLPYKYLKQATQYLDGLGRPLQTVVKQGSLITGAGQAYDFVSPIVYDEHGRETFKYLPFAANEYGGYNSFNDGEFKLNPFQQQDYFYSDANSTSPILNQGQTRYYSKTYFEPSPLNRPLATYAPGNSWVGNHVGISNEYLVNVNADNVRIWEVSENGDFTTPDTYKVGELYKTIVTDEQGHKVVEYKDKEEKIVLKKVQIGNEVEVDGTGGKWLRTYYVYDDLDQLRLVIPPKAVELAESNTWVLHQDLLDGLCFTYKYDERQRMVEKKVPGAGIVYMIYDEWDRPILTQDAKQRATNLWMYTKYDELNRPVYMGLYNYSGNREEMQQAVRTAALGRYETVTHTTSIKYTFSNSFPDVSTTPRLLTVIYYDDYNFAIGRDLAYQQKSNSFDALFEQSYNTDPLYAQPLIQSLQTKGLVTGRLVFTLDGQSVSESIEPALTSIFYDDKGRVLQTASRNTSGGIDISTTQYNFAGQPLKNILQHEKNLNGTSDKSVTIYTTNEYDDLNRLSVVKKKAVGFIYKNNYESPEKTIAKYEYDALGRMQNKKLDIAYEKEDEIPLESLRYDYNIRGWLIGINKKYLDPSQNYQAYFGMELGYDDIKSADASSEYTNPQMNGNIAGTTWKTKGDEVSRKYDFAYDNLNRLLRADFVQKHTTGGTVSWNNSTVDFSVKMGDGIDGTKAYDENGNILRMQQRGLQLGSSHQIDDLRYSYFTYSNQLKNVTDKENVSNTTLGDFNTSANHADYAAKQSIIGNPNATPQQYADASTDYRYDVNGNLVQDQNKSLELIRYNILNLPEYIELKNNKGAISYLYDATGNKLSKTTIDRTPSNKIITTTTSYIAGFVYESKITEPANTPNDDYVDKLQFTGHEEGRIRFNTPTEQEIANGMLFTFAFDYFIKDHLGNIRMVLTDEGKEDQYPPASLEVTRIETERLFYNIPDAATRDKQNVSGYPQNDTRTTPNDKIQELQGDATKIGSSIVLKVMSGDKFNVSASSWYKTNNTTPNSPSGNSLGDLVTALAGGLSAAATAGGHALSPAQINTNNILQPGLTDFFGDPELPAPVTGRPHAFLNWILVDEQFKYVDGGAEQVPDEAVYGNTSTTPEVYTHMLNDIPVTKNGYLYAYVSNETTNIPVFFDNLQVIHYRGVIYEETHYYPFGLTMAGISSRAASVLRNEQKFNGGNELQSAEFSDGRGMELYDAQYRMYDPQVARFNKCDPLSDFFIGISPYSFSYNNPLSFNDPMGLAPADFNHIAGYVKRKDGSIYFDPKIHSQTDLGSNSELTYMGERLKVTQGNKVTWWDENGHSTTTDPGWGNLAEVVINTGRKLKGGIYNGQYYSQIPQYSTSGTNSSFSQRLERVNKKDLDQAKDVFNNYAALLGVSASFIGNSGVEVRSYKDILQLLTLKRMLVNPISTTLGIHAFRSLAAAQQFDKLAAAYTDLHQATLTNPQPSVGRGMFGITIFINVWSGVPGGNGYSKTTYYYDISTREYLGDVSE